MRLHVHTSFKHSTAVVRLNGDIIYKKEADLFHDEVARLSQNGVVLDLKHVRQIDAYGLGRLAILLEKRRNQCTMVVNPQSRVLQLLRVTKLDFCLTPSIWCAPVMRDYQRLAWAA